MKEVIAPWKPNGEPVTDASDKQLLAHLLPGWTGPEADPNPDVLDLWFSSPRLDGGSFANLQLLDEAGNPIPSRLEPGHLRV